MKTPAQVLRACLETPRFLQTLGVGPRQRSPPSAAERAGVGGAGGRGDSVWPMGPRGEQALR